MEHKMVKADWKSSGQLSDVIRKNEKKGWSVVSLGDVFGGSLLVLARDGIRYEHQVVQIFWKLKGKVSRIIAERQREGWQVAAIGNALGGTLLVMKRRLDGVDEELEEILQEEPEGSRRSRKAPEPDEGQPSGDGSPQMRVRAVPGRRLSHGLRRLCTELRRRPPRWYTPSLNTGITGGGAA